MNQERIQHGQFRDFLSTHEHSVACQLVQVGKLFRWLNKVRLNDQRFSKCFMGLIKSSLVTKDHTKIIPISIIRRAWIDSLPRR